MSKPKGDTNVDKYDEAIAYLTRHPEEIPVLWERPTALYHGCLFMCADGLVAGLSECGCLTEIRNGFRTGSNKKAIAPSPELTEAIRNDERLPKWPSDITVESLPVFAEWQRRLDRELKR